MRLFATRVWGLGFSRVPFATFGMKGHLDRLLRLASRGDRLVFVGTQTERTGEEHRGKILGMAEMGFEPLRTLDFVGRAELDPRDFDSAGNFKFPHAVALIRAWRFEPPPVLTHTLARQLSMVATSGVQEIDNPADIEAILSLHAVAIELPPVAALEHMRRLNDMLRPTTGLRPTEANYQVSRSTDGEAWTYALRFGRRDLWKIGWSVDILERCAEINQHIPLELGLDQWAPDLQQRMNSHDQAYQMEQAVLTRLASRRSGFERVRCTSTELQSAWQQALIDVIRS